MLTLLLVSTYGLSSLAIDWNFIDGKAHYSTAKNRVKVLDLGEAFVPSRDCDGSEDCADDGFPGDPVEVL
ncbi:MAG: hypothetical protein AAF202_09695, partial [Pseudomonadota bacterium]